MNFQLSSPKNEIKHPVYEQENAQINTLDEPVSETIFRDLTMIYNKLAYVMLPRFKEEKGAQLRNWDLWGPLLLCLIMAMVLSFTSHTQADVVFGSVFALIWLGAFIVTINAQLLGGNISILISICVLGYCVFPICLGTIVCVIFSSYIGLIIRLVIAAAAFFWSCTSSVAFMSTLVPDDKKMLAVYPCILFYLFLSWFSVLI